MGVADGPLVVADTGNSLVRVVGAEGMHRGSFGKCGKADSADERVVVADLCDHRVQLLATL